MISIRHGVGRPAIISRHGLRRTNRRRVTYERLTASIEVGPIDLRQTLSGTAFLPSDPTVRLGTRSYERATHTPDGPGSIRISWQPDDSRAAIETWGDGATWLLDRAPKLVGLDDDPSGFDPPEGPLRQVWKKQRHNHIGATGTVWHDAAWMIVQQRVTGLDANEQWADMTRALGEPAPGPVDLLLPSDPKHVAKLHYTEFHRFGIERQRAEYLRSVASVAHRLQPLVDGPFVEADEVMTSVRGLGPWTRSWLGTQCWGDPDGVIVGDDGIPSMMTWFLARERKGTDARMLELLEPFRPHRYRVMKLVMASGVKAPRRAPRGARHRIHRR